MRATSKKNMVKVINMDNSCKEKEIKEHFGWVFSMHEKLYQKGCFDCP